MCTEFVREAVLCKARLGLAAAAAAAAPGSFIAFFPAVGILTNHNIGLVRRASSSHTHTHFGKCSKKVGSLGRVWLRIELA